MKKFLQQNWFVLVIAVFFLGVSIAVTADKAKNNLPGKTSNGKDIVFSVDNTDVSADEYYDQLNQASGKQQLFLQFYEAILDSQVPSTAEFEQTVSDNYNSTVNYYYSYYGYGSAYLDQVAQYYYGYPDFKSYIRYSLKAEVLYADYIEKNVTEFVTDEFVAEHSPRTISYCLIKMDDPANPTEDDLERLGKAQEAWQSDKYSAANFAEFAKEFSNDSSTAESGGVLGYVDDNSSLVEAFLEAALQLKEGEVSEWVFDKNYGFFLIKCDSTSYEDYKADANFVSTVLSENKNLANEVVWEVAEKVGVTFADDEIKEYILSQLGVAEREAE